MTSRGNAIFTQNLTSSLVRFWLVLVTEHEVLYLLNVLVAMRQLTL